MERHGFPHRLAKAFLLIGALLLCVFLVKGAAFPAARAEALVEFTLTEGTFEYAEARSILDAVNELRTGEDAWIWNQDDTEKVQLSGLKPLQYSDTLEALAMRRAAELSLCYSHTCPDGTNGVYRVSSWTAGENIALGQDTAEEVFTDWAETDKSYSGQGHRRNMLNGNFAYIGIGCFSHGGTKYWVQLLAGSDAGGSAETLSLPVSFETLPGNLTPLKLGTTLYVGDSIPFSSAQMVFQNTGANRTVKGLVAGAWYTSSDPDILSCENDSFTALQAGTANVSLNAGSASVSFQVDTKEYGSTGPFNIYLSGGMTPTDPLYITIEPPEGVASYAVHLLNNDDCWGNWTDSDETQIVVYPGELINDASDVTNFNLWVYTYNSIGFRTEADAFTIFNVVPGDLTLRLPDGLLEIGEEAFRRTPVRRVVIPSGCTSIGANAFAGCRGLCAVRIPPSVTSIHSTAFDGCPGDLIIEAERGSVAAAFARSKGYALTWIED